MENPFVKLFAIDFKDHLEVKKVRQYGTEICKLGVRLGRGEKSCILLPATKSRNLTACPMFMTP